MNTILEDIVGNRKARVRREGHAEGVRLPARRPFPLVPFGKKPLLICEIKHASPSRGIISRSRDPVETASAYQKQGASTVSVLTERDYFGGSLEHLRRVKRAFPDLCVLRKDFLLDRRDLEISHRAGADAVLLIASMHSPRKLASLYRAAVGKGMGVLLEIHSSRDAASAAGIAPPFTGFNSRNLENFSVDPALPIALRSAVAWPTTAVYESGITGVGEALVALSSGFQGLLVGEAVMRNPTLIPHLIEAYSRSRGDFWLRLFTRDGCIPEACSSPPRPLVKICGITTREDALAAAELGADMLGFVFADSPRRARPSLLEKCADLPTLKAGVVVHRRGDRLPAPQIADLLDSGLLDVVQLHGEERPDECEQLGFPWYKAIRLREDGLSGPLPRYTCPRILLDAHVQGRFGGTGRQVNRELARTAAAGRPLWIAGGLGPENIGEVVADLNPELVDASSGLEASPGRKDHNRLRAFFSEIHKHAENVYESTGKPNPHTFFLNRGGIS